MDAKELLLQYENYRIKEKLLRSELQSEREMIRELYTIPGRMTRQMKNELSYVEKTLETYEEELAKLPQERQRISDLIDELPDRERDVLTRRYIDGMIWEDICETLFYSWTYAHRIHRNGLQMIQERLDQGRFCCDPRQ